MGILNDYNRWGLMGVDVKGILSILHIPTVVKNRDRDTVIRGFYGTSLGSKIEFYFSTDSLLETVTTADLSQIDPPNSVLPPPNVNRHDKSVKQVGNIMWATTRVPLIMTLVGNVKVTSVRLDEEFAITMATKYHPLALHWLIAIMG